MTTIRCPACQHEVTLPLDVASTGRDVYCSWCAKKIPTAPGSDQPALPDTLKMTAEQIERLSGKVPPPRAAP